MTPAVGPNADDDLIDDICDRWLEPSGPGLYFHSNRYEIAPRVLAILRSLPVEQRMEAMGMEVCANEPGYVQCWKEADRG